jgi:hypothetical protein
MIMSLTSALKMETERFSETLASTTQSTWRLKLKEHYQNRHSRENIKPTTSKNVHLRINVN